MSHTSLSVHCPYCTMLQNEFTCPLTPFNNVIFTSVSVSVVLFHITCYVSQAVEREKRGSDGVEDKPLKYVLVYNFMWMVTHWAWLYSVQQTCIQHTETNHSITIFWAGVVVIYLKAFLLFYTTDHTTYRAQFYFLTFCCRPNKQAHW